MYMSACLTNIQCATALTLIFIHNMRFQCKRNSVLEWKKVRQSTRRTKDALYVCQTRRHIHTRISEHMGVSPKTGNKLSVSQMSAVLTYHHFSKHTISDSDFTILTSSNSKFDLEMRESLLISKFKPILNNNISSTPLYLF